MFRNSTFGGLKTFIRTHKRRTGETLTNAAAVDLLVRKALLREIHPDAVRLMQRISNPVSVSELMGIGDGYVDIPLEAAEAPPRPFKIRTGRSPSLRADAAAKLPIFALEVRKTAPTRRGASE